MERYDALNQYHAWYEHWHRYHWIAPHLTQKTVADLACGEGYGSALLAQFSKEVWAVDIDLATIELAKQKYRHNQRVNYIQSDVLHTPMPDNSMDVVVSFETLEHLSQHNELLLEFKRLLKSDGYVVISTPDKEVYSSTDEHNEYHVKELKAEEFQTLMEQYFDHVVFFGQQLKTNSLIEPRQQQVHAKGVQSITVAQGAEQSHIHNQNPPTYLIAIASNNEAAIEPFKHLSGSVFNDANNSLFKHYEAQVERLLLADKRLAELEHQIKQQGAVITQLQARLGL